MVQVLSTSLTTAGVMLVLALAACSGDDPVGDEAAADVHRLVVDLQGGFDGEVVELVLNGRSVAQLDDVVTDEMLGLAESVELQIPEGATDMIVRISDRVEIGTRIDVSGDRFVGVDVTGDEIVLDVRTQPFGYG